MMKNKRLFCSDYMMTINKIMYPCVSVIICVMICMATTFLSGCTNIHTQYDKISKDIYAMDTYMSLSVYENEEAANAILEKATDEIRRIEGLVSAHKEGSELEKLNNSGTATFSKDGVAILEKSIGIYEMTEGAFNPAIYPIMELWGFSTKEYRVPENEELQQKLTNMDASQIRIEYADNNSDDVITEDITNGITAVATVTVPAGMKLDFGGIAKGYTSDRIIALLRENKVESAIINLGGNVHTLGTKPDGTPWNTAIKHPENEGYLGVVEVVDKAVITSGGYERYFEEAGKTYHHIINPQTGYPAESGVISVSIISSDGMLADGLSTALYVMGYEKAVSLWKENSEIFDFVMMTNDGNVYITEGIKDNFASDYSYVVINN